MKILFIILLLVLTLISACEEFEVLPFSHADEIKRYISDSYIGESVFKNADFGKVKEYTFASNDTNYVETIDSIVRFIDVNILSDTIVLEYGTYRYGIATVFDNIYGKVSKTYNNNVIADNFSKQLTQYGLFVKLGENSQKFSGWILFGYKTDEHGVDFESLSNGHIKSTFEDHLNYNEISRTYFPIDSLTVVDENSLIVVSSADDISNWNIFITYESDTGFVTEDLKHTTNDGTLFLDTLRIAPANNRFGNIIFIETIQQVVDSLLKYNYTSIPFEYTK